MKLENSDVASAVASTARKATSRIERIVTNQIGLGNSYYKNVNEQSKRSFELARIISIIGGGILLMTLVAVFIALFLHLGGYTLLLNGIGALIASIVEAVAGLNLVYDKATKQFTRFHLFLDRIQRLSIAHAMCDNILDERRKQDAIEKIVQQLLTNEDRIKE